jgi:ketosteroid isomerase-like protein
MDGSIEERLRACYAALNRRDFDEFETFLHPDVEARSLVMEPEAAVYRGPAGLRRLFEDLLAVFPDWHGDVESVEELGDRAVIARIHVTGTAAGSGLPADYTGFIAVNHDAGMLTRAMFMRTEEEARAALGSESG